MIDTYTPKCFKYAGINAHNFLIIGLRVFVDYSIKLIMSIVRGVNRRTNSELQPHIHQISSQKQRPSPLKNNAQIQNEKMLREMKSLMKQNTRLKHQNLELKQQLMLAKIELQNIRLHTQESLLQLKDKEFQHSQKSRDRFKTKQYSSRALKVDSSVEALLKIENRECTITSTIGKENELLQWGSKQSTVAPSIASFRENTQGTPRYQPYNSGEPNKKQSLPARSKYTKKNQILDKYRKFLSNEEGQNPLTLIEK